MRRLSVVPILGKYRRRDITAERLEEAQKREVRAGRMLLAGEAPALISQTLGVALQTVYPWKTRLDEGRIQALQEMRGRGRPARLDEPNLQALRRALLQSPTEHGFGCELSTLKRVRVLIERQHMVKLSLTHI